MAEVLYRQERLYTCAVAGLRSVLASQFDVRVSEQALRFAGDDANERILDTGAGMRELRRMLVVANRAANTGPRWRLVSKRYGTVADLAREIRAGRYPLASVPRVDAQHVVVVCGYKSGRVRVHDPATGRARWIGSGAFRRSWVAPDGMTWYAVVKGG